MLISRPVDGVVVVVAVDDDEDDDDDDAAADDGCTLLFSIDAVGPLLSHCTIVVD